MPFPDFSNLPAWCLIQVKFHFAAGLIQQHTAATGGGLPPPSFLSVHFCSILCMAWQLSRTDLAHQILRRIFAFLGWVNFLWARWGELAKGKQVPENKVVGSVQLVMGGKAEKGREGEVKETGLFHMTVTITIAEPCCKTSSLYNRRNNNLSMVWHLPLVSWKCFFALHWRSSVNWVTRQGLQATEADEMFVLHKNYCL